MTYQKQGYKQNPPLKSKLAFVGPMIPVLLFSGLLNVMPGIFSQYHGVALTTVSLVVLVAGIFDTVTDPLVGYWSDKVQANTGQRRRFVIVGCVLLALSAWFLFVPMKDGTGQVLIWWFVLWYLLFYWSLTCVNVPYLALVRELATDAKGRNHLFGLYKAATLIGLALISIIPMLPMFGSTKMTPDTLQFSVIVASVLMLPALYAFIRYVPAAQPLHASPANNPLLALKDMLVNRPYGLYVASGLSLGIGFGGYYGLVFILVNSVLGLGEHYIFLNLSHLLLAFLLVKPAVALANSLGHQKVYALGIAASTLGCLSIVSAMYIPGSHYGPLAVVYVGYSMQAVSSTLMAIAAPALLSDIIDYGTLKSGRDQGASYFAISGVLVKIGSVSVGPALGLGLVGLYGFDPAEPVMNDESLFAFTLAMGWIPLLASVLAGWLFYLIPINAARRDIIRKRLDQREARRLPFNQSGDRNFATQSLIKTRSLPNRSVL